MNNHKKQIEKLENIVKELNPDVIIPYININDKYLCFGNINEPDNHKKVIEYIFEGIKPDLKFNSLLELENFFKSKYKDFITLDLKSYVEEIRKDFEQQKNE
jgi:hypothetical protein